MDIVQKIESKLSVILFQGFESGLLINRIKLTSADINTLI